MWLNDVQITDYAISAHRTALLSTHPNHVVIDNLFDEAKLDDVMKVLQQADHWQLQQHTYSALYVDDKQWQKTSPEQRFVQRYSWQCEDSSSELQLNIAQEFLLFLRSNEFMSVLSRIFNVAITDMNVADPDINTNYFRLGANDFIEQHADDSPGREICMLIYLNKDWRANAGGELVFTGKDKPINIAPIFNRCVLFDPASKGSEHWVKALNAQYADEYRYNVTSWYWSE
jgi:Rps23 Pro-64 3,4-dihydroxylase Tpa1-like proline 4-hydroxylase